MTRNRSLPALTVTAAVLLAAGCSGSTSDSSASDSGAGERPVVVSVTEGQVEDLLPGNSQNSNVDNAVFSPLTRVDPDTGDLENLVAESIESEDQLNWTITIGEGWTFHDGSLVTAQSFADSWNLSADPSHALDGNSRMAVFDGYEEMNPSGGGAPSADTLSGVRVVDDRTLEVTLNSPNSLLPYVLSGTAYSPIPAGAADDLAAFATNPVGNGPFRVAEGGWSIGDQDIHLERYDDYAGPVAGVAEINLRVYQPTANPFTDLEAGQIDVALVDGDDLIRAREDMPSQVVDVELPALMYLAFPTYDDRFADQRIREAISLAIDREAIVDSLLSGIAEPATGIGPSGLVGADRSECASCRFDPEQARQLLAEAGGWTGPLTLVTFQDSVNDRVLQAISNQVSENLRLDEVEIVSQPIGQVYDALRAEQAQGPTLLYAGVTYPHVYAMANALLASGASLNLSGYDDATFTAMLGEATAAQDPEDADSLAAAAATYGLSSTPVAPLYYPTAGLVHSEDVEGTTHEFLGGVNLAGLTLRD